MRSLKLVVAAALSFSVVPGLAVAASGYAPDSSYQVGGGSEPVVRAVAFSSTTMYIGGKFTSVRPPGVPQTDTSQNEPRNNAAAFDRSTGRLLSWNPNVNGEVFSLALVGGKVAIGGRFTSVDSHPHSRFAMVDAQTGADTGVKVDANDGVYVVKVGPNGNLFLGGEFGQVNGASRANLAQITPAGALVSNWQPKVEQYFGDTTACPPRCRPKVYAIDFSTDGNLVYFGGHFGLVNGVKRNQGAAVRLADGSNCTTSACVTAWNPSIFSRGNCPTCNTTETSRIYSLHITSTRAYTCGGYWRVNFNESQTTAISRYNVAVFNLTDGKVLPRSSFSAEDDGDTTGCDLHNGVLYIGGHFDYVNDGTSRPVRHHVAAVDAGTGKLLPWNPGTNSHHGVFTIVADGDTVAFGGYFTRIGATDQQGIAKYSGARLAR